MLNFGLYGLEKKKPIYCAHHKKENMINVRHNLCKEENCNTQPAYGIDFPEYCGKHKKESMIDLKSKKCLEKDCNTQPIYGIDFPEYCAKHKKENMKNIRTRKCFDKHCETSANYNYINVRPALYCAIHKLKNILLTSTIFSNL